MPLDTLLHRRAADLFADALDLAAPEREALLNDSGIDPEVVAEVRSLLAVHDGAEAGRADLPSIGDPSFPGPGVSWGGFSPHPWLV